MKRICPLHGLWQKTEQTKRCPNCKIQSSREYDKTLRNKEADKFYHSQRWKQTRNLVLMDNPICNGDNCQQLATMVDHIKPISQGGAKLARTNLQSLCDTCHKIKTAKEKR